MVRAFFVLVAVGAGACSARSSSGPGTSLGGAPGTAMGGTIGAVAGDAGAGGAAGAGGTAAGGAGGGAPEAACAGTGTVLPPPYPTELQFVNDGTTPLYLHTGCLGVEYVISSCASGFSDALQTAFHCACDCDAVSCSGSLSCGACPAASFAIVAAGQSVSLSWDAVAVVEEARGSYTCARSSPVPAGRYRIAVNVYDDADSALNAARGHTVAQDFELPTETGVLAVPLSAP